MDLFASSGKHVREMYTPLNPTFIKQNWGLGVHILIFLIFDSKHTGRLWVLIRTASESGSKVYPQSMFGAKIKLSKLFH